MTKQPVCLVTGVGPGTGAALARRFANEGYRVAMLARSADRLAELEKEINNARALVCDVTDSEALKAVVGSVKETMGAPSVVIHNAVGGALGTFREISPELLEQNSRALSIIVQG